MVVGFIGKSRKGKANYVNEMLDRQGFSVWAPTTAKLPQTDGASSVSIEYFHDTAQNIVFLELSSLHDASMWTGIEDTVTNMHPSEYHRWLALADQDILRAHLFMFLVCHIVVVVHPGSAFDLEYLRMFRILRVLKQHFSMTSTQHVVDAFQGDDRPASRLSPTRCIPSLVFLFTDLRIPAIKREREARGRAKGTNPYKRMQQCLESQIRALLKKSAPSGGGGGYEEPLYSLDHVPTLVFVASNVTADPMDTLLNYLMMVPLDGEPVTSLGDVCPSAVSKPNTTRDGMNLLCEYILRQVRIMSSKRMELPTGRAWQTAMLPLLEALLGPYYRSALPDANDRGGLLPALLGYTDAEGKFSIARCEQAVPPAQAIYIADLPPLYNTATHNAQLNKAIREFRSIACGPLVEVYEDLLRKDLTAGWSNGRRRCDAVSLMGRACALPHHDDAAHRSEVTWLAACTCGKTRRLRDDPFELKAANVSFFKDVPCCTMVVVSPAELADAGGLEAGSWGMARLGQLSIYRASVGLEQEGFLPGREYLASVNLSYAAPAPAAAESWPELGAKSPTKRGGGGGGGGGGATQDAAGAWPSPSDAASKKAAGRGRGRGRGGDSGGTRKQSDVAAEAVASARVLAGFEYECRFGHRFLAPVPTDHDGTVLDMPHPWRMDCSGPSAEAHTAQLTRVVIGVPAQPPLALMKLGIEAVSESDTSRQHAIELGGERLSLPKDSLVSIRLPFVLLHHNTIIDAGYRISLRKVRIEPQT